MFDVVVLGRSLYHLIEIYLHAKNSACPSRAHRHKLHSLTAGETQREHSWFSFTVPEQTQTLACNLCRVTERPAELSKSPDIPAFPAVSWDSGIISRKSSLRCLNKCCNYSASLMASSSLLFPNMLLQIFASQDSKQTYQ